MTDDPQRTDRLWSYLKADAPSRREKFAEFLRDLKSLDEATARVWARGRPARCSITHP